MPDSCFADSNVLLYTLSKETIKQEIAFGIWRQGVVISTQVIMEFTNVCLKKFKLSKQVAFESAINLMEGSLVKPVTQNTVRMALDVSQKFNVSHWDSLIIASALEARCSTLYTEDLSHGQVINGKLKIINPFMA
jgi:predicted nucleic acid-binding protein